MSGNAELVHRWFEQVGTRFENPQASFELLHPDVVLDATRTTNTDFATTFRGHEGVRKFWRLFLSAWEDWKFRPEDIVASGDRVILTMYARARGRRSGIEFEYRTGQIWTFRDGRVVRCDFYDDREAADAALAG